MILQSNQDHSIFETPAGIEFNLASINKTKKIIGTKN